MNHVPTTPEISEREIRHADKVRELSGECLVLLENDGTLPLQNRGKIALYGNGARNTIKGGTGSGDVYTRDFVTVEDGLIEAGFEVTTTDWLSRFDAAMKEARDTYQALAEKWAEENHSEPFLYNFGKAMPEPSISRITDADIADSETDTAIYVLSRNSGEGADRKNHKGDYQLKNSELHAIRTLAEYYENVILVLNVGGIVNLSEIREIDGINSILLMSQLGSQGGNILADVLTGKVTPSGKLTDTWALRYEDYPNAQTFAACNDDLMDEYYTEGIFVGYRYFDTFGFDVAYPFGYGLSYTDFTITPLTSKLTGTTLTVTANVMNVGSQFAGKEVVQLYVSAPTGAIPKPYQALKAFTKTKTLAPAATELVTLVVDVRSFASYDEAESRYVLEPGDYVIRIGNSSRNTYVSCAIRVPELIVTEQCSKLLDYAGDVTELKSYGISEDTSDYTVHTLKAEDVKTLTHDEISIPRTPLEDTAADRVTIEDVRNGKADLNQLVAQLSADELIHLCIGNFKGEGSKDQIGDAAITVPGAAGETSQIIADRGTEPQILADGPAGLRLTPVYERDNTTYYQYCTAIPIATALAQSWNMDLIQAIGSVVGAEMEEFGIKLWLAPGMNIHRNPLCGRNFEYYSEDPFLTGNCAAADTLGVQSHAGKGTTVKHFAANNQEDNRMFVNEHISEQALREIYLKGFELCVKKSQPLSVMTSYNIINGIHTANRYDLITGILRGEWNFAGMVMTDWLTCNSLSYTFYPELDEKYGKSNAGACIMAGNDLIMPGGNEEYRELCEEYQAGHVTLRALQECAKRVLNLQIN